MNVDRDTVPMSSDAAVASVALPLPAVELSWMGPAEVPVELELETRPVELMLKLTPVELLLGGRRMHSMAPASEYMPMGQAMHSAIIVFGA